MLAPMGAKNKSDKDIRHGIFKAQIYFNPTVTAADAIVASAKNMADSLKTKINRHLGGEALTALSNIQKYFPTPPQKNPPRIWHNIRPTQK